MVIFTIVPNAQLERVNAILVVKLDIGQKRAGSDEIRVTAVVNWKELHAILAAALHCLSSSTIPIQINN